MFGTSARAVLVSSSHLAWMRVFDHRLFLALKQGLTLLKLSYLCLTNLADCKARFERGLSA